MILDYYQSIMPEGPEVAVTADNLHRVLAGKVLQSVTTVSGRYTKRVPEGWETLQQALPLRIQSIQSKGKFTWWTLKKGKTVLYLFNTFGMSGRWCFDSSATSRVVFECQDTVCSYYDTRNFGTFKVVTNPLLLERKVSTLHPDLLKDSYDTLPIVGKRNLATILTDQTKAGSGIGNYLVCEILYRAGISPYRTGDSLSPTELDVLVSTIRYTLKLAYRRNRTGYFLALPECLGKVHYRDYQPEVHLEREERFQFLVYRREKDPNGHPVRPAKDLVKGRTIWWVPDVQY